MSNSMSEGVSWLPTSENQMSPISATVLEGAEVVRTAAVSYATPIIHQVYIQDTTPIQGLTAVSSNGLFINSSRTNTLLPARIKSSVSESRTRVDSPVESSSIVSSCERLSVSCGHSQLAAPVSSVACSILGSTLIQNTSHCSSSSRLSIPISIVPSESSKSTSISALSSTTALLVSPVQSSASLGLPLSSSSVIMPSSLPSSLSSHSLTFDVSSPPTTSPDSSSSSVSNMSIPSVSSPPPASARTDDELTSLSWLQDSNLLRGTALLPIKTTNGVDSPQGEKRRSRSSKKDKNESLESSALVIVEVPFKSESDMEMKGDSVTSDSGDETKDSSDHLYSHQRVGNHRPMPYNPKVHTNTKPPYSFSCLIFMAIEESSDKALPVKDIYTWILDHYPYYKSAPTGWKNSVRHNLSLNKCFCKVDKSPNLGKGSLWMVDPTFRPNLVQAMSKTPFTPVSPLDRRCVLSPKAILPSKSNCNYAEASKMSHGMLEQDIHDELTSDMPNLNDSETLNGATQNSPKLQLPIRQYYRTSSFENNCKKVEPLKVKLKSLVNISSNNVTSSSSESCPQEAKKVVCVCSTTEAQCKNISSGDVQLEDVDAAAAMLVLKHGPWMLPPDRESFMQLRKSRNSSDTDHTPCTEKRRKQKCTETVTDEENLMLISASPILDHSYYSNHTKGREIIMNSSELLHLNPALTHWNFSSQESFSTPKKDESSVSEPGEGYSSDENDNSRENGVISLYHRPLEESNALLNLAAVASALASTRDDSFESSRVPDYRETHVVSSESHCKSQSEVTLKSTINNNVLPVRLARRKVNQENGSSTPLSSDHFKSNAKKRCLDLDFEPSDADASKVAKSNSSAVVLTHSNSSSSNKINNNNNNCIRNKNKSRKVKKLHLRPSRKVS